MTQAEVQVERAEDFKALHSGKKLLVLPNAWDVPSARVFEDAGFKAVATSSAGVMVSLGYPDGEEVPIGEYLAAVKRIAEKVRIPLSVDVVGGFGSSADEAVRTARGVLRAGGVGVNIEDFVHADKKLLSVEAQARKLRALVHLRDSSKVRFVINARTDAYRFGSGDEEDRFEEAVRRGLEYRDLGADCVYPMGLVDGGLIGRYVKEVGCPVNVMVRKGLPSVPELQKLKVARLSFGPSASYAAMGLLRRAAAEVMKDGTYHSLVDGAITFDELNSLAGKKG